MKRIRGRKGRKSSIFIVILSVIFMGVFLFSLCQIVLWKQDNDKGVTILKEIKKDIKVITEDAEKAEYKIDFDSLKEKNNDTVAFIKINGTKIEYPVVKTSNNDYYLTHSFNKVSNSAGWVFANYLNRFDGTDKNITLFAHSRKDGSMFGTLYKTLGSKWQENLENHQIMFITNNSSDFYQVFSTYKILAEDYYIKSDFESDDEYQEFLNTLKARSNYNYPVDLSYHDSIITLSTCASDDNYRIVLHAKKVINNG